MNKAVKRFALAGAATLMALGVSWGATAAANAAPLSYADTSVQVLPVQHVDAITGMGATFDAHALNVGSTVVGTVGTDLGPNHTIVFSAPEGIHGPLTWTAAETNFPGFSFSLAGSTLSVTAPSHVGALIPGALPTITVKATDGTAVAFDTLVVTNGTVTSANHVDTLTITQTPDTVTTIGANNNATGHVDFTPVSATYTLANAPAGTALAGNSLVASTSVPGLYDHLAVTAADTMGATAVDTFNVAVKGHPVVVPPPAPTTPFVYHGHVLTGDQHNATVGWLDGIPDNATAWGSGMVNGHVNHCVEVFVYGFDRPAGTAHVGFTCDNGDPAANVGYLRGLEPGHTYALFVQPATGHYGDGNNHPIPGTNPQAHITVITPA